MNGSALKSYPASRIKRTRSTKAEVRARRARSMTSRALAAGDGQADLLSCDRRRPRSENRERLRHGANRPDAYASGGRRCRLIGSPISTRWQRKPRTFNSVEEALENTARLYRKALWVVHPRLCRGLARKGRAGGRRLSDHFEVRRAAHGGARVRVAKLFAAKPPNTSPISKCRRTSIISAILTRAGRTPRARLKKRCARWRPMRKSISSAWPSRHGRSRIGICRRGRRRPLTAGRKASTMSRSSLTRSRRTSFARLLRRPSKRTCRLSSTPCCKSPRRASKD